VHLADHRVLVVSLVADQRAMLLVPREVAPLERVAVVGRRVPRAAPEAS
jgi:hypothetical protein